MIFLILSIVFMAGMPVVLRAATREGASPWVLNSVFRIIGGGVALVSLGTVSRSLGSSLTMELVAAMVLGGACYWLTAYASTHAIREGHLGITWTVTRFGMVVPTLASLFYFGEFALLTERGLSSLLGGLLLVMLAILLFAVDQVRHYQKTGTLQVTWKWAIWLVLAFLTMGAWETSLAYAGNLPDDPSRFLFLHGVFLTSGLFSVFLLVGGKRTPTRIEWKYGLLAALCAVVGSGLRPWAVMELGGRIVFPLTAIGVMMLVQVAGQGIWKERVGRWGWTGFGAAFLAVWLFRF